MGGLRYLFADMNSFFASVEQQERAGLRGQPVAVVPTLVDSTCCIAASYEAKAYGVKTGTPVREARRLCPHLHLIEARVRLYVQYHHKVVEAVESCLHLDVLANHMDRLDQKFGRHTVYLGGMWRAQEAAPTRISFTQIPGLEGPEW